MRRHAAQARSCRCGIYGAELSMVAPYLDAFGLTFAGGIHRIIGQVSLAYRVPLLVADVDDAHLPHAIRAIATQR